MSTVSIVPYAAAYRDAFAALNRAWIERHFTLEPADRRYLDDPEGTILAKGGEVFFALDGSRVVGTCALIADGPHAFELAKMAVVDDQQGRGIGRALVEHALGFAEERGATRVFLLSSSSLRVALHLYERAGFVHVPFSVSEYARGDVRMEIALGERRESRSEVRDPRFDS